MSTLTRGAWILRHAIAILLLPFIVVVVVPGWLMEARGGWVTQLPAELTAAPPAAIAAHAAGGLLLLLGAALFAWCLALFAGVGRGTLAPWDPPPHFVAIGPYRYVRNPMILGVLGVLVGEALIHRSPRLAAWALAFWLLNEVYFILLEEPMLEQRFGESYRAYRASVPRWVPRRPPRSL
ncbi:MAG TPA: methyltransferase [Gemmatimonadaceae bacterium]|nr:methyltransferase [Gemmatimonadaceae bacterium]